MSQDRNHSSRSFATMALATALLTIGLIVFGAVVRVTDSGLGCGNAWPSCNGTFFPPLDNVTAWIEWLHRLFAVLIGLFGLVTLWLAVRAYRTRNRFVLNATLIAAGLFLLQSALGALVVVLDLPPTMVTLHLGTAMLLLGALLVAALWATARPHAHYASDRFTVLAYITTVLSLVIILTGALVRGSGATLACIDWPLCNGQILPLGQGQLALIHMLHRLAVVALGVTIVMLVWMAYKQRTDGRLRLFAVLALVAFLAQAGIGALYVLTVAAPLWGALHVTFAALTWAALVTLTVLEMVNTRNVNSMGQQWPQQSKPLPN